MLKRGLAVVLALSVAVATVTAVQYAAEVDPRALEVLPRPRVAVAAIATLLATTGYFGLRWLRWHYLVRRFTRRIRARDSVVLYFATLPALLTPFGLGELVRVLALRKRSPQATRHLLLVFALERGFEAAAVAGVALFDQGLPVALGPSVAVGVLAVLLHRHLTRRGEGRSLLGFAPVAVGLSLLEWVLVGAAFSFLLAEVTGVASSPSAVASLGLATLEGGLTGLPLGTGVTSTALIEELTRLGYPRAPAIVAAAAYRMGTAWYAVAAGVVCAALFRREVVALFRDAGPADHF
ncbi:MAG: flippase-like domain-containing protein, partial [Deltaproteobacteria bacterium]|nr:flippase-like domain-containing protein [Deltaproteobacteria bacterium]